METFNPKVETSKLIGSILLEIFGFGYYLFEFYSFFHNQQMVSLNDSSFVIFQLRLIMLIIALPLLYLFRVASFFDWDGALSNTISKMTKSENQNIFLQVKLFYHATYFLLFIILILRLFE